MTTHKPGFAAQMKSYPGTFWVANTMEIFERMSWYGWFTVMAVYVTGSVATGGLGFSTELRGALQGIVPFFLYLFPVITGALADRYGYKRMFIIAYLIMIVSYYLLGQFTTVPMFFMAFMFVAVGAAIFKPVVVGTVAKVTDASNSSTGFGIFYMMVNIGGFAGPIVAGLVRGWGWEYVFMACAFWAVINLLIVLFFYKEPAVESGEERTGGLRKVLDNAVEVLGNPRFFITVFVVLFALMFANLDVWWFQKVTWKACWIFIPIWLVFNVVWDRLMPKGSGDHRNSAFKGRFFLFRRMHCSNWRFALFLLIMSGFWTSFNQIFYTMPEYIRDFVDTRPIIRAVEGVFGESDANDPDVGIASAMATINDRERAEVVREISELRTALAQTSDTHAEEEALREVSRSLLHSKVRMHPDELRGHLQWEPIASEGHVLIASTLQGLLDNRPTGQFTADELEVTMAEPIAAAVNKLKEGGLKLLPTQLVALIADETADAASQSEEAVGLAEVNQITDRVIIEGRQINPEFIVNINAGAIVLFQVLISFMMGRFHRFTTMIVGMLIAAVGIGFSSLAGSEGLIGVGGLIWVVAGGIFIFSFGEMMASPTSQEYVGRIAPKGKTALYMGYYFVAMALGNLFGGILSGELMQKFTYDMERPDYMWMTFGGIMAFTAFIFLLYNKFALPRGSSHTMT